MKPVQLIDLAEREPTVTTLVPRLKISKNTSSAAVGTAAPPTPPEVVAHLVPAVVSHVAVPPTQKRLAVNYFSRLVKPHLEVEGILRLKVM